MFTWCTKENWRDENFDLNWAENENGRFDTEFEALNDARRYVPEDDTQVLYVE